MMYQRLFDILIDQFFDWFLGDIVLIVSSSLHCRPLAQSIPAAAALNWVIKDGLGQLGGILLASRVNTLFDTNPKVRVQSG